jgi:hypothetical protein
MKNKETLEQAAERYDGENDASDIKSFIEGAKWQQERSYSEEEVLELIWKYETRKTSMVGYGNVKKWFEQFKKE